MDYKKTNCEYDFCTVGIFDKITNICVLEIHNVPTQEMRFNHSECIDKIQDIFHEIMKTNASGYIVEINSYNDKKVITYSY